MALVNVVAIAQGSSEYNITVVIKSKSMRRAVRTIHERLNAAGLSDARRVRRIAAGAR